MALYIKKGMGGSRNGKSRTAKTEVLKSDSKKNRRTNDKKIIKKELKIWISQKSFVSL